MAPEGELPVADVWVLRPSELPRWAAGAKVAAVPTQLTTRDGPYSWPDVLADWRGQLLSWDGTVYGLPLAGEGLVVCYRTDWLAAPADREAFQRRFGRAPDPPETWEQFVELAEFLRDQKGKPSLPPLPADDRALGRLFWAIAAAHARRSVPTGEPESATSTDDLFSFYYDLKWAKPQIASPGFVHALGLLRRLQRCRPEGTAPVPERAFAQGKAGLCLTDAAWVAAFQRAPAVRDRFGIANVPGGDRWFDLKGHEHRTANPNRVPYLGGSGWVAVVPRAAASPEAAFDLLADLTGPQTSTQMTLAPRFGAGPTREEHLRRERWDAYDLGPAATQQLRDALADSLLHRTIRNPVLCLRTPREAPHRAALDAQLCKALKADGADVAAALAAAAKQWQELDRAQGLEAHRIDNALSLGLLRQENH